MSFPWRHSYWQLLAWHWRSFRTSFYRNSSRPPHVSVINRLRTTPLPATAVHSVELCSNTHFTSSGWFSKKLQMFNKATCLKEMFQLLTCNMNRKEYMFARTSSSGLISILWVWTRQLTRLCCECGTGTICAFGKVISNNDSITSKQSRVRNVKTFGTK